MWANKFRFNSDKTEVLLIRRLNPGLGVKSVLDKVQLFIKEQVHNLGALLDPTLLSEIHLVAVDRTALCCFSLMHQLYSYQEKTALLTVMPFSHLGKVNIRHFTSAVPENCLKTSTGTKRCSQSFGQGLSFTSKRILQDWKISCNGQPNGQWTAVTPL